MTKSKEVAWERKKRKEENNVIIVQLLKSFKESTDAGKQ